MSKQVRLEDSIHKKIKLLSTKKDSKIQIEVNRILKEWLEENDKEIPK